MISKIIYLAFVLLLKGNASTASPTVNLAYNLKYIGPHNLHDTYTQVRSISSRASIMDALVSTYHIKPIVRDLNLAQRNGELFETLIKREIAWSYPEYNQFGLLHCEEMKFYQPFDSASYIELNTEDYRISIQRFTKSADYFKAAEQAKTLQTQCLIKSLEKGDPSSCSVSQIPFCFSDSWHQLWWKETS